LEFYIHTPCAFTSTDLEAVFFSPWQKQKGLFPADGRDALLTILYYLPRLFTFLQSVKCNPSELPGGGGAAVT
jgi:hypothetical protein